MNKQLEKLYNKMDNEQDVRLKARMIASIRLVELNKDTPLEELDGWALEEIQLLSDIINKRDTRWCKIDG